MQRIQDPTAVAAQPAVPALTGPAGFFTDGNPGTGVPATVVPDWWLNMTQEEMVAILTAAGKPADGSATVLQALNLLFRALLTVVTSTLAVTVPTGKGQALVLLWAGGGGGGGSGGQYGAASGGGGGEWRVALVPGLQSGQSIEVTIGAGGAPGSNGGAPTNGSPGSNSSFGPYVTAVGGGAGEQALNGVQTSTIPGGGGGTFGGGTMGLPIAGIGGGNGQSFGTVVAGGQGGGTFATSNQQLSIQANGIPGVFPGGGGNGGSAGGDGGAGASGLCIILWV